MRSSDLTAPPRHSIPNYFEVWYTADTSGAWCHHSTRSTLPEAKVAAADAYAHTLARVVRIVHCKRQVMNFIPYPRR